MKVKELIEKLKEFDPGLEVIVSGYNDYRGISKLKIDKYILDCTRERTISFCDYNYFKEQSETDTKGGKKRFDTRFQGKEPEDMLLIY